MSMRYNKIQYVAIALLLTTGMASCAYDKSTDIIPTPDNKELVLNIRTASVGGTTRSATNITDGGTTTTLTAAEQTITDLTLGVYNQSTGDLKGEVKNLTGVVNATATQFSQNFSASEAVYEAGDVVMVAINVNDAITNSSTKDNFWHNQLTIDQALTYGTSAVDASKLPMFGKAALTGGTDGLFTANVDVRHLVAKVSLASLAVDFDDDVAHNNLASFTPTQIFLRNVPDKMDLEMDALGKKVFTNVTPSAYYQGEIGNATNFKDYLGTSALSVAPLTTSSTTLASTYTFYTMPNVAGRSSLTDANRTQLIIKGDYKEAPNRTAHTAYYAINLGTTADYSVESNYHYIVTAVIKGDGATTVDGAIGAIQNLTSTVTVADWTEEASSVVVNGTGYNYSAAGPNYTGIQVGDLIYADGYWNTAYDASFATEHGAPIAIVFSTTTTAYDQALGFTHGYAMALKRYNSGNNVANWCVAGLQSTQVTSTLVTTLADVKADKDGLKHCREAYAYIDANGGNYSDLTAIYAAISGYQGEVAAPANTSGWYLPSIGQQYSWLQAAKPDVYTGSEAWTDNTTYWTRSGERAAAAGYMNAWLAAKGLTVTTHYDSWAQGHYLWSSTERTGSYPFHLSFYTDGSLLLNGSYDKSYAGIQVRAVLAF